MKEMKEEEKQGVLEDDALIYKRDRDRTAKENFAGMDTKGKIQYFIQYYAVKTALFLFLICLSVYMVVHVVTKKDMAMGILAVNGDGENPVATDASYFSDFLEENGYDAKKNTINLNYSMYLKTGSDDGISQSSLEMIQVLFFSQAIDVFMADEEFFAKMAQENYLMDLETVLPENLLERYAGALVYTDVVILGEEGESFRTERRLCGIRIEPDNRWIAGTGWYRTPVIVGLAEGAGNRELAVRMLEDILQEK